MRGGNCHVSRNALAWGREYSRGRQPVVKNESQVCGSDWPGILGSKALFTVQRCSNSWNRETGDVVSFT